MNHDEFILKIINKIEHVNIHYLNRYIRMCLIFRTKNNNKTTSLHKHHILPKASDAFPEFSNFVIFEWNMVRLTTRQHTLLHYILSKALPKLKSQIYAANMLMNKIHINISDKQKHSFKEKVSLILADDVAKKDFKRKTKMVKNTVSGVSYRIPIDAELTENEINDGAYFKKSEFHTKYHDPITSKEYWIDTRYEIPENLQKGRSQKFKDRVKKTSIGNTANLGKLAYINIETKHRIFVNSDIDAPVGYARGLGENLKLKETIKEKGLLKGEKNPMYGRKRTDMNNTLECFDDDNNLLLCVKLSAPQTYEIIPRQLYDKNKNILITEENIKIQFPRSYKKYMSFINKRYNVTYAYDYSSKS